MFIASLRENLQALIGATYTAQISPLWGWGCDPQPQNPIVPEQFSSQCTNVVWSDLVEQLQNINRQVMAMRSHPYKRTGIGISRFSTKSDQARLGQKFSTDKHR